MIEQFKAWSVSFKTAPLELRELISLDEHQTKALLLKLKDILGITEAIIVSTCNRTEIYYLSSENLTLELTKLLCIEKGLKSDQLIGHVQEILDGKEALHYFFEVSTGLHSQVVGDIQLPNQIKNAYQWCADSQMAGPFLHRLLHSTFFVNKRVFQETSFRDGAASTSYAAVETMEAFLPQIARPKILILGLGEIGLDTARTLYDKGYRGFVVANRTQEKTIALRQEMEFEVSTLENALNEISNYDIIISSIRSEEPLIKANAFIKNKKIHYLLDLSVPRSVSAEVADLPGVVIFDLDEIQRKSSEAIEKRKSSIPMVQSIIEEALNEFNDWSNQMVVSPTIQKLKNALEQIRKEEMSKYLKNMNEGEVAMMEKVTASMMQKIIKLPVLQLKAACKRGEAETLIDVLNDLFDLEKVEA